MKDIRYCQMCGEAYQYCPNCSEYDDQPRWRFMFDTENCLKIYDAINAYRTNAMDAKTAKAKLEKLDLSGKDKINKGFKVFIDEIYAKAGTKNNIVKE